MAKFSAESLSDIEYDFRGFLDSDKNPIEDFGTVPEPTKEAVNDAMNRMRAAFDELGIQTADNSPEAISEAMNRVRDDDDDTFAALQEKLLDIIAELCDGTPKRESLAKLRYRPFMAFFGYLMGEVVNPEVSKPGTTQSRGRLRSV